jgi:hypothetical protein
LRETEDAAQLERLIAPEVAQDDDYVRSQTYQTIGYERREEFMPVMKAFLISLHEQRIAVISLSRYTFVSNANRLAALPFISQRVIALLFKATIYTETPVFIANRDDVSQFYFVFMFLLRLGRLADIELKTVTSASTRKQLHARLVNQ